MVCRPVFEELTVLANGDIVCSSSDVDGQRVYGNVHVDRIADVWAGPLYREIRDWQLRTAPGTFCPAIDEDCPRRVVRATPFDRPDGMSVRLLKLEPTTHCNLACPQCPVVKNFPAKPHLDEYRARKTLSVETMLDVVDQLPDLERILYFNYGEPFLHRGTVPFLRELKRRRPDVWVGTNTHGLALTPDVVEALAGEVLIDKFVVSIDGAFPESYAGYRVGGDLDRVLRNLRALVEARKRAGTEERFEIVWQYIFFEWNDSDEELARAKEIAEDIGVPIQWVMTCTDGGSERLRHRSAEFDRLTGGGDSYAAMHRPLQLRTILANGGVAEGRYLAEIAAERIEAEPPAPRRSDGFETPDVPSVAAPPGATVSLSLRVRNLAERYWISSTKEACFRMGVLLQSASGRPLSELPILHDADGRYPYLPDEARPPGGDARFVIRFAAPEAPGPYRLLVDIVEQGVCGLHDRGSHPLVLTLDVV